MKKLLLFAILAFTLAPHAHAQTAQETAQWLNAKLKAAMYFGVIAGDTSISTTSMNSHTMYSLNGNTGEFSDWVDAFSVSFGDLTDVSSKSGYENDGKGQVPVTLIILTGKVSQCVQQQPCQDEPFVAIDLNSSTPPETVNSIVKALKHIAQLNGARMVNDDLFK